MYKNLGEIYEGLEKTREKLISTVEDLPSEKQDWRENGEGWSIKEIVEHVSLVESGSLRIAQKLFGKAESNAIESETLPPIPTDFFGKLESVRDRKLQAPERIHPQGEQSLADSLAKLKEDRGVLQDLRAKLEKIDASVPTFPHPALGDLNIYQWIIMIGLHERRHLMQIERILQNN
jgi:DinB superfamily